MMDTAPPTTHAEPGREVRRVLEDFVAAPDTTGRLTTLVRLVRATRVDESRDGQRTLVGRFLDEVELPGELRDRFGAALAAVLADIAARLTSSQPAAALSNVLVVAAGTAVLAWLFEVGAGRPFLAPGEALDTLAAMSPVHSGTIWYATLTGVVLWLASLIGGWFDDWCVYHRIAEGIAQRPARTEGGRARWRWLGEKVTRHAAGWGTNISLGFMLGFSSSSAETMAETRCLVTIKWG